MNYSGNNASNNNANNKKQNMVTVKLKTAIMTITSTILVDLCRYKSSDVKLWRELSVKYLYVNLN